MLPARRVVLAGVGAESELNAEAVRKGYGAAATAARNAGARKVVSPLPPVSDGFALDESLTAAVEAASMATYRFTNHEGSVKSAKPKPSLDSLTFAAGNADGTAIEAAIARGEAVASAVNLARDLVNEPASVLTPKEVAEIAAEVAAEHDLEITVFDKKKLAAGAQDPEHLLDRAHLGRCGQVVNHQRGDDAIEAVLLSQSQGARTRLGRRGNA